MPSSSLSIYAKMKKAPHSVSNLNPILELLSHQGMDPKLLGILHPFSLHSLRESDIATRSGRWPRATDWFLGSWKPHEGPEGSAQCCLPVPPSADNMHHRLHPPVSLPCAERSRLPQRRPSILTVKLKNLYIHGNHAFFSELSFSSLLCQELEIHAIFL